MLERHASPVVWQHIVGPAFAICWPQAPEQQSALVWQSADAAAQAHVPLTQLPLQQSLSAAHAAWTASQHLPAEHAKPSQQSTAEVHVEPCGEQEQLPASHVDEPQHSLESAHADPGEAQHVPDGGTQAAGGLAVTWQLSPVQQSLFLLQTPDVETHAHVPPEQYPVAHSWLPMHWAPLGMRQVWSIQE